MSENKAEKLQRDKPNHPAEDALDKLQGIADLSRDELLVLARRLHAQQIGLERQNHELRRAVEDISKSARANEELRQRAMAQVRQRDKELAHIGRLHVAGSLAVGLAHEIRQPLHSINNLARGILLRLEKGMLDAVEFKAVIEEVTARTRQATETVNRLGMLVRKQVPTVRASVDVNRLVHEALSLFDMDVRALGIDVRTKLAEELPLIDADPVQISQVVVNLVRNALDAMADAPLGQRLLTLTTGLTADRHVEVGVCDTGKGLSKEAAERVFELFFTTKSDGLGIGLSISRSIIESHGGRMQVDPNPPQGAFFRFALPLTERKACPAL